MFFVYYTFGVLYIFTYRMHSVHVYAFESRISA